MTARPRPIPHSMPSRHAILTTPSQTRSPPNMAARAASLPALLRHHDGSPEADAALDAFEKRHSGHALAMDKWFQIQAAAPGPRAVERVKALTGHPAFSITNPNRV